MNQLERRCFDEHLTAWGSAAADARTILCRFNTLYACTPAPESFWCSYPQRDAFVLINTDLSEA